ncbi:hypothetical protein HX889_41510 [Pseudomonas reactans]|nr:hypothetical protein [Pseudomonas reactans]
MNTEREQRGIDAVDIEKLSSVTDSLELNVLLKRILKGITVSPTGKNWRIEVGHISGDTQGFILTNGELRFVTDTIKLRKLLDEF